MEKSTVIYLRTSTEEQNPQNQLKSCVELAVKLGLKDYEVVEEKVSGWKEDAERTKFDLIHKGIQSKQIKNLICWDLDRLYRNRKKLISFFAFCKMCKCKIYSVRQDWLESINTIQEPFNEIMNDLMIQIMGWLAEEESSKKSERIKLAIRHTDGKTMSAYGNKWGRKTVKRDEVLVHNIKTLRKKGLSFRQILKHPEVYYHDKHGNKKQLSIGLLHKLSQ